MIDRLELNAKGQELREQFGEDAVSPIDIFAVAGQIDDLTLVFYPLGENISGMCIRDQNVKLVAINSGMSYGRQRYSLAHEFYHLYYDDAMGYNVCAKKFDIKAENEKNADQFASYFLAPYSSLRMLVRRLKGDDELTYEHMIRLEQYYGMSHQAMLWRLISEKYITKEQAEQLGVGVMKKARQLGYEDTLYRPMPLTVQKRTYGHYLRQVEELQNRGMVSNGKIEEFLLEAFREDLVFGEDMSSGEEMFD